MTVSAEKRARLQARRRVMLPEEYSPQEVAAAKAALEKMDAPATPEKPVDGKAVGVVKPAAATSEASGGSKEAVKK